MKKLITAVLLFSLARLAFATGITCPDPNSLAGTYETAARTGFTPNKLILRRLPGDTYAASLSSHWAPRANDDGTLGTIGSFEGAFELLEPWSCVALLEVVQKSKDDELNPISCFLLFRFLGQQSVEVSALGECEFFHGHRATPAGSYKRQGP